MAKHRQSLRVRIPLYRHPRNDWRLALHKEIVKVAAKRAVVYRPDDRLELIVAMYLSEDKIGWHDLDNRLKDIMDALQGRAGGPKTEHRLQAVVPNDHQIQKVIIEKRVPPPQSLGMGHLTIRKHKEVANQALHCRKHP